MIPYRATLDVSRELAQYLARLLQAERRRRGTPKASRALTCFWHAVLVLRWFRDRADPAALALDHGVSRATAYRYIDEAIEVLAAQAPDLHQALWQAKDQGAAHLVLDGTLIVSDRCSEQTMSVKGRPVDLWYSGKARRHGGNIQALSAPGGFPLWLSTVEPGSVHDMTAARKHLLGALYKAAAEGLPTLADLAYEGAGIGVFTPSKPLTGGQTPDIDTRARDLLLRALRCQGQRGFALLTQRWRVLQHITASPSKIGISPKPRLSSPISSTADSAKPVRSPHWPHQSRHQRPPDVDTGPVPETTDLADLRSIRRRPVVGSVINEYHHAA
ncbi:IS5-like element IS470 family transposase [Actinomadura vinacea]|uniref:IS5-like element IS470 family transposase n=1 Tax=Actinomadura vinacea TaxID=115336 RepID=A0ABP5WU73_9ACTN